MPSSARKSSVGLSRRGPQKAHIPFRGDNPEVGKKTGIAVEHVERKSDGFEPFEDIMSQADKRTLPKKAKARKKKQLPPSPVAEDEDGEMSMDLDDYGPQENNSPDRPSPRQTSFVQMDQEDDDDHGDDEELEQAQEESPVRQSKQDKGKKRAAPREEEEEIEEKLVQEGILQGMDDVQLGQSDDDEQGTSHSTMQPQMEQQPAKRRGRPKKTEIADEERSETPVGDGLVQEDITQGMDDVQPGESDDDGEQGPSHPTKKPRIEQQPAKRRGRPKMTEIADRERSETPEGVRRGKRHRYRPLEWWRQEKVVYGRRESGITLVPHIKAILRIPREEPIPLGKQKRKRGRTKPRDKSETVVAEPPLGYNPEEGWDDPTPQQGIVMDFLTREEVQRRIAFTAKMLEPRAAANKDWFFQKVFGDGDFIAAGQLIIPPKSRKPSKGTKDNTYIFYVIEGAVNLRVHDTSLILATGGMFMVPRGNTYFIENIADRDAKLFFTQARKIAMGEEEQAASIFPLPPGTPGLAHRSPASRRQSGTLSSPQLTAHRSNSVGAGPSGQLNGHVVTAGKKPDSQGAGTKRAASLKV